MGRKQAQAFLAALIAWPLAAQDYNPATIPPQIIGSPQMMTPLNGGDDSTRLVQFAFPFDYYDQTYTQAWVSSNGFVSFNNIGHMCCNGSPIEQAPRNTIYGLWTDLISWGNPYFHTDANSSIFGWYNTQEYGSGLSNTFEIVIFPDGKIQWNYGDVNNRWHMVTAGLTGPTMADSIAIYYGQNVNLLDNTSYSTNVVPVVKEPEPTIVPIPGVVSPVASPIDTVITQEPVVEQVIEQTQTETTQPTATQQEQVVATTSSATPTTTTQAASVQTETVAVQSEQVVAEKAQEETKQKDATRLSPDEVARLAATGTSDGSGNTELSQAEVSQALNAVSEQAAQAEEARQQSQSQQPDQIIAENASEGQEQSVIRVSVSEAGKAALAEYQFNLDNQPLQTTEAAGSANIFTIQTQSDQPQVQVVDNRQTDTSPSSQSVTLELLNMATTQQEMAADEPHDVNEMNTEDAEVMVQLAAIPVGYSAYTQLRIPDILFYKPRSIYQNRRIPDQNMALYRLMNSQDIRWQEMVGGQYE